MTAPDPTPKVSLTGKAPAEPKPADPVDTEPKPLPSFLTDGMPARRAGVALLVPVIVVGGVALALVSPPVVGVILAVLAGVTVLAGVVWQARSRGRRKARAATGDSRGGTRGADGGRRGPRTAGQSRRGPGQSRAGNGRFASGLHKLTGGRFGKPRAKPHGDTRPGATPARKPSLGARLRSRVPSRLGGTRPSRSPGGGGGSTKGTPARPGPLGRARGALSKMGSRFTGKPKGGDAAPAGKRRGGKKPGKPGADRPRGRKPGKTRHDEVRECRTAPDALPPKAKGSKPSRWGRFGYRLHNGFLRAATGLGNEVRAGKDGMVGSVLAAPFKRPPTPPFSVGIEDDTADPLPEAWRTKPRPASEIEWPPEPPPSHRKPVPPLAWPTDDDHPALPSHVSSHVSSHRPDQLRHHTTPIRPTPRGEAMSAQKYIAMVDLSTPERRLETCNDAAAAARADAALCDESAEILLNDARIADTMPNLSDHAEKLRSDARDLQEDRDRRLTYASSLDAKAAPGLGAPISV